MSSKVSGLLSEGLDPILQREMVEPGLVKTFPVVLPLMTAVNKAHVLMLARQGIVSSDVARALAAAIGELERLGPQAFTLDPAREDHFFNYEARLIDLAGTEVGGRIHTARSRNDLNATIDRLRARAVALRLSAGLLELRTALIAQATLHRDVLMPGYTHLQPAQPITFGYYLAGIAHALERDHRRLAECWARLNLCPLGAGAIAGTSFPIDRAATARALGFDDVVPHAQDSVGSRDYLAELLGVVALMATNWGRMAQDFYVMTTHEFATLVFPDRIAQTSSMMPQKRNMIALEHLKASAAQMLGAQVTSIAGARGAGFSFSLEACRYPFLWAWDAFDEACRALAIAAVVVRAAEPQRERMLDLVRRNFATATDLADALVREAGLSFRDAHHLVGAVVRAALDRGLPADRIDAALVAAEAEALLGRRVVLADDVVRRAVDPASAAESRSGTGGPSSADMAAMLAALASRLEADRAEDGARRAGVDAAATQLTADFTALAG